MGVSIGMTTSYLIGYRLGVPFVQKYGKYVHFGPDKLDRTSQWFTSYGNKLLAIAYFIPGVRHFTGYFAGIVRIPFRTFALYAYTGAFLWVGTFGTFVTIGKLLGPQWEKFHSIITKYLLVGVAIVGVLILLVYFLKKYRMPIIQFLVNLPSRSHHLFHSLGRVKFMVALTTAAFLFFSLFTLGLIQDYLDNEFDQFNEVILVMMGSLMEDFSFEWVNSASILFSLPAGIIIVTWAVIWIWRMGKDRKLEISSLVITLVGGELWGELLTNVFHRIGTPTSTGDAAWIDIRFPSEPTLTAVVLYGYISFLLLRHTSLVG
ncbi:DedA family protein [Paenibacillus periandrae]|uniref:DedA family protein n=1 Tax=Paenibacillus periandrae TaxID=1761741 RepID=UPI0023DDEFBF|nr:VTT domain-containing protein [Paenibacillus periandrae]